MEFPNPRRISYPPPPPLSSERSAMFSYPPPPPDLLTLSLSPPMPGFSGNTSPFCVPPPPPLAPSPVHIPLSLYKSVAQSSSTWDPSPVRNPVEPKPASSGYGSFGRNSSSYNDPWIDQGTSGEAYAAYCGDSISTISLGRSLRLKHLCDFQSNIHKDNGNKSDEVSRRSLVDPSGLLNEVTYPPFADLSSAAEQPNTSGLECFPRRYRSLDSFARGPLPYAQPTAGSTSNGLCPQRDINGLGDFNDRYADHALPKPDYPTISLDDKDKQSYGERSNYQSVVNSSNACNSSLSSLRVSFVIGSLPGSMPLSSDVNKAMLDEVKGCDEKQSQCPDSVEEGSNVGWKSKLEISELKNSDAENGGQEGDVFLNSQPVLLGTTYPDTDLRLAAEDAKLDENACAAPVENSSPPTITIPTHVVKPCSSSGKNVQSFVKAMHGLSEVLLATFSNESYKLKDDDYKLLKSVIGNLEAFIANHKVKAEDSSQTSLMEAAHSPDLRDDDVNLNDSIHDLKTKKHCLTSSSDGENDIKNVIPEHHDSGLGGFNGMAQPVGPVQNYRRESSFKQLQKVDDALDKISGLLRKLQLRRDTINGQTSSEVEENLSGLDDIHLGREEGICNPLPLFNEGRRGQIGLSKSPPEFRSPALQDPRPFIFSEFDDDEDDAESNPTVNSEFDDEEDDDDEEINPTDDEDDDDEEEINPIDDEDDDDVDEESNPTVNSEFDYDDDEEASNPTVNSEFDDGDDEEEDGVGNCFAKYAMDRVFYTGLASPHSSCISTPVEEHQSAGSDRSLSEWVLVDETDADFP